MEVLYLLLPLLLQLLQPLQPLLLLPLGSLLLLQTTNNRSKTSRRLPSYLHDCISQNAPPPSSWPELPAWPSLWPCWVPSSSPSPPSLPSSSSCLSSSCRPRPPLQKKKKHSLVINVSANRSCATTAPSYPLLLAPPLPVPPSPLQEELSEGAWPLQPSLALS